METITSQVIASLTARLKPITDANEDSRGGERAVYLTLLPVLIPAITSLLITLEKVHTDEKTKYLNPMEFIARFLLRNNISACKPLCKKVEEIQDLVNEHASFIRDGV